MANKINYDITKHPADFARETVALDIPLHSALEQLEERIGVGDEWIKDMTFYYEAIAEHYSLSAWETSLNGEIED